VLWQGSGCHLWTLCQTEQLAHQRHHSTVATSKQPEQPPGLHMPGGRPPVSACQVRQGQRQPAVAGGAGAHAQGMYRVGGDDDMCQPLAVRTMW
jgi:hypothetical protein